MLGVHVGEQKWDKVEVTDLTGDHGLHYDVMIDVFGEDYLHIRGNSNELYENEWTWSLASGPQELHFRDISTDGVAEWRFSSGEKD